MKQDEHSTASAKQRRLYYGVLSVLALVTIAALVVTMTAGSQEEPDALQQAQEEESRDSQEISQEEVAFAPEESSAAEPVQGDLIDPNQEIETVEGNSSSEESSAEESSKEEAEESETEETQPVEAPVQEVETFDPASDKMAWPVSGNVLMEYSAEALIYDETLDQYRANDSMSIGAAPGEAVVAAAAGPVKSIGQNDRLGNYVVISHGNGLETTYGQLQEAVDVVVDETVSKGETIGYVAEPTWYSLALGDHLEFQVTLDGTPVDPTLYLESTLDE